MRQQFHPSHLWQIQFKTEDSLVKLECVNKSAKESALKLNKILNDTKVKFEHEKEFLRKEHNLEVKAWRKDLGHKRKITKNLKKVLCAK